MFRGVIRLRSFIAPVAAILAGCSPSPVGYAIETVEMGDVRDVVPATGTLEPLSSVEVRAETVGQVTAVYVSANETVRAGQPLARLKPDRAALGVEAAQAEVAATGATIQQARARAEQADRDLVNRRVLAERGFISGAKLAETEAEAREATAGVERAEAEARGASIRLRSASVGLEDVVLRAPRDGVVLSRSIEVGSSVGPAQSEPLFVVASQTSRMRVKALVAEPDIGRVIQGMDAVFTVEAHPGQTFRGQVVQILQSPVRDRNFVSYPVVVEVDNPNGRLFPGMTATVEFIHADVRNVIRAPLLALYFTPENYTPTLPPDVMRRLKRTGLDQNRDALLGAEVGSLYARGKRRLFVMTPDGPIAREVRIGAETDEFVEVSEGLRVGERIIVAPADSLDRDSGG